MSIVILLLIVSVASAQDSRIKENDAIGNITKGAMYSAGSTLLAYEGLFRFTNLSPKTCKIIAVAFGVAFNSTMTYAAEHNDKSKGYEYNTNHITAKLSGTPIGISVVSLIGKDKRKRFNNKIKEDDY